MWIGARTWEVAIDGVWSIGSTVLEASHCDQCASFIRRVWGPRPLLAMTAIAAISGFGGQYLEYSISGHPFAGSIYWPVLLFSFAYAMRTRHVLFRSPIDDPVVMDDALIVFRSLALPLLPGIALLLYFDGLMQVILDPFAIPTIRDALHAVQVLMGGVEKFTGLAAATAVIVGSLCYSKDWTSALFDLFVRFVIFKLIIAFALLLLGLLSLGRIVSWIGMAFASVALSPTAIARIDAIGEHGIMALAYTALIGGIWLVAESSFDTLRLDGEVDVLDALDKLMEEQKDEQDEDEGEDEAGSRPDDDEAASSPVGPSSVNPG